MILSQTDPTQPFVIRLDGVDPAIVVAVVVAILLYVFVIAGMFAFTLIKSQRQPAPQALVAALALLTFIALSSSIVIRSQALETIAATGIGAIAGAVSQQFKSKNEELPDEEEKEKQDGNPEHRDSDGERAGEA